MSFNVSSLTSIVNDLTAAGITPTNASAERELCRNLVPVEEGDAVFAGPSPSKRVFRATGNAPSATGTYPSHGKPVKPQRKPEDVLKDQLKQRDEELDKLRAEVEEMRRLRAEKAELEAELEADPPPRGKGGKFTKKPELQEQGVEQWAR